MFTHLFSPSQNLVPYFWEFCDQILVLDLQRSILPPEPQELANWQAGGRAERRCIWDLGQGSDFSSAYKAKPALPQPLSMKQSVSQISALLWYNLLHCSLHIYQLNLVLPSYLHAYLSPYLGTFLPTYHPTYLPSFLTTYLPRYLSPYLGTYPPT